MAAVQLGNAQKRPRLSLQIKTTLDTSTRSKSTRSLATVDPKDPTAFNTLANIYTAGIGRSTCRKAGPLAALHGLQSLSLIIPVDHANSKMLVTTPLTGHYPPRSGAHDADQAAIFTLSPTGKDMFVPSEPLAATHIEPSYQRLRVPRLQLGAYAQPAPYTHPRSLRSILRNSPLPPRTAISPSLKRQSWRLQEKSARKVGYSSPLEQEITTNKYTISHIDLLIEDFSPCSSSPTAAEQETILDVALAFTANELKDGGQTLGPFEEMRRRVAGQSLDSPLSPLGIRKRKKSEKKRRWVWTIGPDAEDER